MSEGITTEWDRLVELSTAYLQATMQGDEERTREAYEAWKDYECLVAESAQVQEIIRDASMSLENF